MKRLRMLLVLVLGIVVLCAVRTPDVQADTSAVTVDGYECRAFGGSGQLWPVVTLRRNYANADQRTTSVFYLYDGDTQIQSLSGGLVNDDQVTATSGVVTVGVGNTVEIAPWGGHFGDPSVVSTHQALDPRKTYTVSYRAFDFGDGDYSWKRNISCGFCDGVTLTETLGNNAHVEEGHQVSSYGNSTAACGGYWLEKKKARFTPQGLALDGKTAWVSGYDGMGTNAKGETGDDLCYVERIDLITGAVLSGPTKLGAGCHHAGGMALISQGLLVVDTGKLMLVSKSNPATVLKQWPIQRWPKAGAKVPTGDRETSCPAQSRPASTRSISGSFLVTGVSGKIGLGSFSEDDCGGVWMFDIAALLKNNGTRLWRSRPATGTAGEDYLVGAGYKSAAYNANGGVFRSGKLWATGSTSTCGQLLTPSGAKGFGPGAEEVEFDKNGYLWGIFEATSAPYKKSGKVQPMLVMFDPAKITKSGGKCG